jgi:hypothetical protein
MHVPWASVALLTSLAGVAGCEPALNWRDVPVGDARIQLPCRPQTQRRTLPLLGREVSVQLQACDSSGVTWAVLDVEAPAGQADAMVVALDEALAGNLGAPAAMTGAADAASAPAASSAVPVSPAFGAAHRMRGRREDGSSTSADVSYARQGDRVLQLVALLPREPDAAIAAGLEHFHASVSAARR